MLAQSDWPPFLDWVPDGFNTWEAWVALGTFTLAFATFWLSRQTRRDVDAATRSAEAARRSAEISERAFAAGIRPMLSQSLLKPPEVVRSGKVVTARVALRNVGSGLALIQRMGWEDLPPGVTLIATASSGAVPADEDTWVIYELSCDNEAEAEALRERLHQDEGGLTVLVRYLDATGGQPTRTQVKMVYSSDTGWRYEQVAVFDGDSPTAFAVLLGRTTIAAVIGQAVEHDQAMPITPHGGTARER